MLVPVACVFDQLVIALKGAAQVLLNAPTGAGKSTWLPLQLLQEPWLDGRIILLEPRRLAARNIAQRLAESLHEKPGGQVGYRMRGESCVGESTRLEVVTEGVLTRMLQDDPALSGVRLVILDEFHERSLQADLALALLLDVQQGLRDDLKLLVMSATLDNLALSRLLPAAPVISTQGRAYPVERRFVNLSARQSFVQEVAAVCRGLLAQESGSMLVFLPGAGEIQQVQRALEAHLPENVLICPLYGALPLHQQRQAIDVVPAPCRKVVLATNIAQTSLTIEGVRLVVDGALERVGCFDARTGLTRLSLQRISQAAMIQRAGRAGRLEPGICLHLISQEQAERAAIHGEPQMVQSDLSQLLMEVTQWGCQQVDQLSWLDVPPAVNLSVARQLLQQLGALQSGRLTALGQRMAQLGCEPRLARLLTGAKTADERSTAAYLAAILEDPPHKTRDLCWLLQQRNSRWHRRAQQLLQRLNMPAGRCDPSLAAGLLALAFADRIARRRDIDGRYQLANGIGAILSRDDPLSRQHWLIAPLLLPVDNQPDARILLALPLDIDQLLAQHPQLLQQTDEAIWQPSKGTLLAQRRWQIGELVVKTQTLEKPNIRQLHQAMLKGIREQGMRLLYWSEQAQQLRLRMHCAACYLPEYCWPVVDEQALLAGLEQWLLPYMANFTSLEALKQLDLTQPLYSLLDWTQRQRLDNELPTHYRVPTGSLIAIRYHEDNPPVLAVRLQEMFGEARTPHIAQGRVALTLELLSPARRPLQITSDLAAFWRGAYREVQKEMKGRYAKHRWPDDPANSVPSRDSQKWRGKR